MKSLRRRTTVAGLLFVSPWIVGFAAFYLIPCALSLWFSLSDYSILNPPAYVGMENYAQMAGDEVFWKSLGNTAWFAAFSLPLGTALALGLALLLNGPVVAKGFYRTMFFLPSLVPLVALGILWRWLLNMEYGLVNEVLSFAGLPRMDWLGDARTSKPGLLLTTLWGVGNAVVIYMAGLQDVPRSLYEAARVDGANWWQQIRAVTLPMISPVIYFNAMMGCIGVLQIFALPYVMTAVAGGSPGQPARSTYFYTMYLFDQAFLYLDMGYASALAWVLFAMIAILTALAHALSRRHVVYGAN